MWSIMTEIHSRAIRTTGVLGPEEAERMWGSNECSKDGHQARRVMYAALHTRPPPHMQNK